MVRVVALVALVGLMVGTGTAVADESTVTPLPITVRPAQSEPTQVVVVPGDHLWKISARHLEGRPEPVAPYWREVIDVNRPNLRSGDPDLIYPGEVIELP